MTTSPPPFQAPAPSPRTKPSHTRSTSRPLLGVLEILRHGAPLRRSALRTVGRRRRSRVPGCLSSHGAAGSGRRSAGKPQVIKFTLLKLERLLYYKQYHPDFIRTFCLNAARMDEEDIELQNALLGRFVDARQVLDIETYVKTSCLVPGLHQLTKDLDELAFSGLPVVASDERRQAPSMRGCASIISRTPGARRTARPTTGFSSAHDGPPTVTLSSTPSGLTTAASNAPRRSCRPRRPRSSPGSRASSAARDHR